MPKKIRITSVPTGEAPLWVREAWVGLVLPVLERTKPGTSQKGVLGGELSPEHFKSFTVLFIDAIAALQQKSKETGKAADWWLENTLQTRLYFGEQFCEVVG